MARSVAGVRAVVGLVALELERPREAVELVEQIARLALGKHGVGGDLQTGLVAFLLLVFPPAIG
jgi:hypothetical protein